MIFSQVDAPFPYYEVKTKKEFDRGSAVNGTHIPKFVKIELTLDIYRGHGTICYSCHGLIKKGELVGKEMWSASHCRNCIEIPTEPIEVWNIAYTMKRRSRKNPSGKVELMLIATPEKLEEFSQAVVTLQNDVLISKTPLASYLV